MTHGYKWLKLACLMLGAWSSSPAAAAQAATEPVYTVHGGYSHAFADPDRLAEDGPGYFVGGSRMLGDHFSLDLSLFGHRFSDDTDAPGVVEWHENGIKGDLSFHYLHGQRFSPYVSLGLGYTRNDERSSGFHDAGVLGEAGIGLLAFPAGMGRLGFITDIHYRLMKMDYPQSDSFGEVIARAGLVWRITPSPRR